jgi:hypothetical protein
MSSSSAILIALQSTQKYLFQFVSPVLVFIGIIGCILNLIVFTQKTLRKNPCSLYFIAYNVVNLIYIQGLLLSSTLTVGYNIDDTIYSIPICRIHIYIPVSCNVLSPFCLILASIDRVLITSPNALTRQRSTRRLAYICIIGGTLFWALFHIHVLILATITQVGPHSFLCYFQPGGQLTFMGYYQVIKEILTFSLMIIFGLWTIYNVHNIQHIRAAPTASVCRTTMGNTPRSKFSKDRQLIIMLVVDVIIYALFSFAIAVFIMYQQITQNIAKSFDQVQIESAIRNLCLFSMGIPICISCYANLIVSKTFRNEVKKLFVRQ